jgi:hypothetical protein
MDMGHLCDERCRPIRAWFRPRGSAGRTTDEARVVAGQGAGALAALDMLATGTEVARGER